MLYTNINLKKEEKEMEWGTLTQFTVGESGRGRQLISLPCNPNQEDITKGLHTDLTIGLTKSNRPRICKGTDDKMYMILSARGGYTRRGNGIIRVLKGTQDKVNILARGNGADGRAGNIGYWDCMVIKVPSTDYVVRVRTSGAGYGTDADVYLIHDAAVYHCTDDTLESCCDTLGIAIPYDITADDNWLTL